MWSRSRFAPRPAARCGSLSWVGTRANGRRTSAHSMPPTAGAPLRRRACPTRTAVPAGAVSRSFLALLTHPWVPSGAAWGNTPFSHRFWAANGPEQMNGEPVSYTHLRAHETDSYL